MTSLKENSSPIYIFCPGSRIRQTLGEIFLCQLNITCAESKVVCLHTPLARACSLVCNTTTSHLIVISVFNNTIYASWCHPMSLDSSIILACLDTFVENWPICRSSHWNILNIHLSRFLSSIGLSGVHAWPFTTSISNSGCIIQPLTYGLGHNTGTPVSFGTVLEKPISNKVV